MTNSRVPNAAKPSTFRKLPEVSRYRDNPLVDHDSSQRTVSLDVRKIIVAIRKRQNGPGKFHGFMSAALRRAAARLLAKCAST